MDYFAEVRRSDVPYRNNYLKCITKLTAIVSLAVLKKWQNVLNSTSSTLN